MVLSLNTTLSFYNIFPHNLYLHLFANRHIVRYKLNKELLKKVGIVNTDFVGLEKTRRFGILSIF